MICRLRKADLSHKQFSALCSVALGRTPNVPIRRLLGRWRDLVVINDEAHHVYGEKRGRKGEDAEYIKWSKILERISKAARVSLVLDLSATPWYGSGSPKPEGTLFEWLVSDFSVYDAFESGLVKVVRLPRSRRAGARLPGPVGPSQGSQDQGGIPTCLQGRDR